MINISLTYKENGVQVPPVADFDEFMNSTFEWRVKATSARLKGSPTMLAQDGQEVGLVKDENGNIDLPYTGAAMPNNTKKYPILRKQFGYFEDAEESLDFIFLENETNVKYTSEEDLTTYPRTYYYAFYQPDYHIYEAWIKDFFIDYVGEANGRNSVNTPMGNTTVRFVNSGEGTTVITPLNKNSVNIFFYVIEDVLSEEGFVRVTFYCNGEFIGTAKSEKKNISSIGFGADTNCEMHGFVEMGRKLGLLTEGQIIEVNDALVNKYLVNQPVALPYATNVDFTIVGDIVTASFLYVSPNSVAINEEATKVTWSVDSTGGGIQAMETIHAVDNMLSFNRSITPGKFLNGQLIRVNIYVEDVNGFGCLLPGVKLV